MVVLGVILALIGWLAGISVLLWIGIILLVVGLVLNVSGRAAPYGARWYERITRSQNETIGSAGTRAGPVVSPFRPMAPCTRSAASGLAGVPAPVCLGRFSLSEA